MKINFVILTGIVSFVSYLIYENFLPIYSPVLEFILVVGTLSCLFLNLQEKEEKQDG